MKKKYLCLLLALVIAAGAFAGCSDKDGKTASPVIKGAEETAVRPDTAFNYKEDVFAFDADGKELTSSIKITLPKGNKITVSGDNITFGNYGDYKLTYSVENSKGKSFVKERLVRVRNVYNVYNLCATMPPLFSALNIVRDTTPSLLYYTRTGTFDLTKIPEWVTWKREGGKENFDAINAEVLKIAKEDPNSYFHLFRDDVRIHTEVMLFAANGIAEDRYRITLVPDGAYTYNAAFIYRGKDGYDKWQKQKNKYYDALENARKGKDYGFMDKVDPADVPLDTCAALSTQKENVEYWLQYPEFLNSSDERMKAELDKCHLREKKPEVMYDALTEEQKTVFLDMCKLDKQSFDKEYFTEDGNYLIVTGTNPVGGGFTDAQFLDILNQIVSEYKGYNLLFKPHPNAIPSESNAKFAYDFLTANNIKILPGRMPMEVISWVYNTTAMGGFDSSLYMAVPRQNVKFFIAPSAESLNEQSKQLYSGDPGIKYFQPAATPQP